MALSQTHKILLLANNKLHPLLVQSQQTTC